MVAAVSVLIGIEHKPNPTHRLSVAVIPVGAVADVSLGDIAAAAERVLPVRCSVGRAVAESQAGYDSHRDQFVAGKVIEHHKPAKPKAAGLAVFVTEQDLYEGELNFVLGLADAKKGCCIISLARMRLGLPSPRLLQERAEKTAVHELGHLLGLGHCPDRECVMAFSNTVGDTDHKRCRLCDSCRKRLRRLVPAR